MKKTLKVALVAVCVLFMGNFAKAQTKIGYVNFSELVRAMPEFKTVQTQVDAYQKQFIDQLNTMNTTFQTEAKDFQTKSATMTDAARTAKQGELADMQQRMQNFQTDAQQKVEAKSNELIKPITDKVRTTVEEVAKEKGYGYVFDSSTTQFVVSPPSDDLGAAVKAKLGLK